MLAQAFDPTRTERLATLVSQAFSPERQFDIANLHEAFKFNESPFYKLKWSL